MEIGRVQQLPVWVTDERGVLLGDRHAHAYLPGHLAPPGLKKGDRLEVFVYLAKDGTRTATTELPDAGVGELIVAHVVGKTAHGVFVDIGLPKDLFVPWAFQYVRLDEGDRAVVYIDVDPDTGRLVGHTKLVDSLSLDTAKLQVGQQVELLVYGFNEVGALVVVDRKHPGIVYADRLRRQPRVGDTLDGWIERIRDDGKLDISVVPIGRAGRDHATDALLHALSVHDGFLPLTDHSDPEDVRRTLGLSKKAFKKAAGALFKQGRIRLDADGIRVVAPPAPDAR